MMNILTCLSASLIVTVCSAHAVTIAPFPGLPKMIEEADAIVIIRVDEHIKVSPGPDLRTRHRCYVYQSLKGNLPESERVFLSLIDTRTSFVSPFSIGATHLAFLSTNEIGGESTFRNLQYEGSILRLSPFGHESEPDGWNLERKIKILVERSIAYWDREQQREKELSLAVITGMSSPLRRELEQAHKTRWKSEQWQKSIRISPILDFDGITANAIVSYQSDGNYWTIQINFFSKVREEVKKESPPTLKVFNPAGAPLTVVSDNGYSDIGNLFVVYRVEAQSVEEIAEVELEFKGMKRRVLFRPKADQERRDSTNSDSSDGSSAFDVSEIEAFWNGLWNVAPKPDPDRLAAKEVERLEGMWKCRFGVTPDLIRLSILPNHKVEITGEKDGQPWTKAGEWKIVNDKCVILWKGEPPSFIIRIKDGFFMFDPWATTMLSPLTR
jgi:hypothetical protein